jgi:hypothetical protein
LLGRDHYGLVLGWQKAIAPIRFAIGRLAADIGNRHVRRQVLVLTAESVADPRTRARKTFEDRSRVHEHAARSVRVRLRLHRVDEGDVVDVLRHVRQQRADHRAALAGRCERPRTLHEVAVLSLERDQILFAGQRLAMVLRQRWLKFPQIQMGSAARTEDLKHALRLGRELRRAIARLPRRRDVATQQAAKADAR